MSWSLPALVARHAADAPDAVAVVEGDRRRTWRDLDAAASAVSGGLAARGVTPGRRVVLAMPTQADAAIAILGVLRAGAIAVPLPAGLTERERSAVLELVAPALVLDEAAAATTVGDPEGRGADADDPEAPAVVVLTSGTTGRPKGVVLSSRALAASADAWLAALPPATGWAMPLGLGHVAGLGILWRAVRDRVGVRLLDPADSTALAAALNADETISHVSLVPSQLVRLLDATGDAPPPPWVRAVPLGGGPVPSGLVRRALEAGWPVVPTYGLSEMASGVTALAAAEAHDAVRVPGLAGRPLPGVSLSIDRPDGDGVGEILVIGPARCSGYLGEPAVPATEPLRTGDLGRLDESGRLIVLERRTDRIVRGGENIDPAEVEAVLEAHPLIAEAAVVARPNEVWGQVPVAAIVPAPAAAASDGRAPAAAVAAPDDATLAAYARSDLAGFKVPAAFVRLDALPRTPGGKLRRDAVRALVAGEPAGELARPGGDAIGWRVTGDGARQVVLLHGTLSTARQLDRFAAALAADGATVHAIDRRGSGSGRLRDPRPLDVAVHVDDLRAYLDARGIERAVIVGVSLGGVVALETAARLPDSAEAVVAWEPPYGAVADADGRAWFARVAADTARAHRDRGRAGAAETFLRAVAGNAAWDRLSDRARAFLVDEGDGALSDAGLTGLEPDGLAAITAPVLLLTGGASEAFYAPLADELSRRIPGAVRRHVPDLRHPAPITDPVPVADAIRAFLDPILPALDPDLEPAR